jgi:hypothetical protein
MDYSHFSVNTPLIVAVTAIKVGHKLRNDGDGHASASAHGAGGSMLKTLDILIGVATVMLLFCAGCSGQFQRNGARTNSEDNGRKRRLRRLPALRP